MIYETVCSKCTTIIRDMPPALSSDKGMEIMCPNCNNVVISFYGDRHEFCKFIKSGIEKERAGISEE